MPFTHKQIAVSFELGEGSFGESGSDAIKLSGPLRAAAEITATGGPAYSTCHLAIYGMTLSHMNKLSTLGMRVAIMRKNVLTVEAGDVGGGLSVAYRGQIIDAWGDFNAQPEVAFYVNAGAGALAALKPIPVTTYNGLADVATIMKGLASQAGLGFTNDGVASHLIDPYFPGTIREQMRRCAEAAGINWDDSDGKTLAIWPSGGFRGGDIPIISADTGMIGYPSFTQSGIELTTLYNPSINFGQRIKVKSSLTAANGTWYIQGITHSLQSEMPGGEWNSRIVAVEPGLFASGGISTK
jgi:hypothetical protein